MEKRFLDSPIDLLRNGRLLRAKDLGLTPTINTSLDANQSFPRLSRKLKSVNKVQLSKALLKPEGMDSISFSTQATNNSFRADNTSYLGESYSQSFLQEDSILNPNPYKGVITFNIKTSEIIMTNKIASEMLGYTPEEMISLNFKDIIIKEKGQFALPDMLFSDKGEMIVYNGKVVELEHKDGSKVAVSCWFTQAENSENNELYIAVIEPVQRVVSHLLLDDFGMIMATDDMALSLFHCKEESFVGHNIIKWIPNILWPDTVENLNEEKRIQRTTGSNESKQSFPLTLRIDPYEGDSEISLSDTTTTLPSYALTLWVFTNMSGMLLVTADGLIVDCNPIFSQLALGYVREQLIGKMMSDVLLNFTEPRSGHYTSEVHHENGSFIPVSYFVNGPVEGIDIFQVWLAIASPVNNNKSILGLSELSKNESSIKPCETDGNQSKEQEAHEEMCSGEFLEHYQFVKQIGSGGFGSVHLAYRNEDKKLVVAKFIKKSKVYAESWIVNENDRRLPFEIHFLSQINHDHIVTMLEYFENDTYFQLVMEKHGFGMDLFEFIEKTNGVPEPLGAYIAMQLVDAVDYLHSNGILHRDIKDENVVLDDLFHAKLIDFGSAAHLTDKPFKAFCGTFEYCSPEVLKGNPYLGPELEVWALGVTIYVLIFGRNPFSGIEEILRNPLEFPNSASSSLKQLLSGMMDRNVEERYSLEEVGSNPWLSQPVLIEDYDFYDICDLNRSDVEFQNSRFMIDDSSIVKLATSTPYKGITSKHDKLDQSSLHINDDSVNFPVPELVFNDISTQVEE